MAAGQERGKARPQALHFLEVSGLRHECSHRGSSRVAGGEVWVWGPFLRQRGVHADRRVAPCTHMQALNEMNTYSSEVLNCKIFISINVAISSQRWG